MAKEKRPVGSDFRRAAALAGKEIVILPDG
jgi:hypothetical protein